MTITKQVVRLSNRKYVKNWQYSQGHFDVVETDDILEAMEMEEENFMVFFLEKGARLVDVKINVEVSPVDGVAHKRMVKRLAEARQAQKEDGELLGQNKSIFTYL